MLKCYEKEKIDMKIKERGVGDRKYKSSNQNRCEAPFQSAKKHRKIQGAMNAVVYGVF